jgi:hypothetical protein
MSLGGAWRIACSLRREHFVELVAEGKASLEPVNRLLGLELGRNREASIP